MTVAAEPDKPQATEPAAPAPLRERLEGIADKFESQASAPEPAAAQAAADGAEKPQDGSEQKPAETTQPPPPPEKIVVSPEQLGDTKYWGGLDAQGWERMERDYPVETHRYKASSAAATKRINEANAEAERILSEARAKANPDTRTDSPDDEPSPEMLAAIEQSQSYDPKEAAKGHRKIAELNAAIVARAIAAPQEQAQKTLDDATKLAIQQHADLAGYLRNDADTVALDKIADASPLLTALIKTGTVENIAIALVEASKQLGEQKKAAAAKVAAEAAAAKARETAATVRSNARPASADVLNSQGAPPAKPSLKERMGRIVDEWGASA